MNIERRVALLEQRKSLGNRKVHFIKAIDTTASERQIAELVGAGIVGPCDGILCLIGWNPCQRRNT
jgi:hypothetical protein